MCAPNPALVAADLSVEAFSCFHVSAHAEPGLLPRLIALFAKRGLVPALFHARRDAELLSVEVAIADLSDAVARHIAETIRQMPSVLAVLSER